MNPCLGQRTVLIRPNPELADPHFLNYLLNSPEMQGAMMALANGATVAHLNMKDIRKLALPDLPDIEVQGIVGRLLSSYDELIENNARRIEILEEMAQAIYREWFVEFRYPGHEDVPLVDSELGPIPEGWEARELREVVRVNEHSLKAGAEIGEIQYVDIASVDVGRISKTQTIEFSEAPGRARRKGQHGDIIWSTVRPNRRAYAQLIDPPTNLVMSTGFAVISPVSLPSSLLKQMLSTDAFVDYLSSRATGATYPAVTPSVFEEARFVVADEATNSKFNELAEPIDTLIAFLKSEIEILTETRDMLLPKLISGEIDVSELDFELADSSV
jgi:type I restriction enzyme S subunit